MLPWANLPHAFVTGLSRAPDVRLIKEIDEGLDTAQWPPGRTDPQVGFAGRVTTFSRFKWSPGGRSESVEAAPDPHLIARLLQ
jgi:hypothetical protein